MDLGKGKVKKGLMIKTWERCKSFSGLGRKNSSGIGHALKMKSKSWPHGLIGRAATSDENRGKKCKVAPEGCFSIYVGPQKQRFVIKTECVNHPLFKTLLEEAESEYGYSTDGPLMLPCDVHIFVKVLVEMEYPDEISSLQGCNFGRSHSSYQLLTPPRIVAMNKF
ncbi:auxin-responsive protein SAUR40-like [Olea europaea var. sylvestris]|uniref:Auxin-responsive SAUR32-like n=1 Tax=Olea europaea subsp. europaea TaxID=158383 RepID=A0A8S0SQZ0_OLEEU|nr:auxin-responsive protein SAUR40-like [Olea europaea var. sylvestris]CAA2995175.1 auxin-responsive SAUR32-like [Olea europaea subsp. europaea]